MRPEKASLASLIDSMVAESTFLYFITYKGLNVAQFNALREQLDEAGGDCRVLKNTFLALSLNNSDVAMPEDGIFTGDTAVVFGSGDPAATAKVIKKFGEEHAQVSFKGGVLESQFLDSEGTKAIADLPSIEQIHAEIVHCIKAPASSLVRVLKDAAGGRLVRVLMNHANAAEEQA